MSLIRRGTEKAGRGADRQRTGRANRSLYVRRFRLRNLSAEYKVEALPATKVKRVIVYSEYPDIAGRSTFPKSEKVLFLDKWDDV